MSNILFDDVGARLVGHVLIRDADTKETIRDVFNAIHRENLSQALALSLANRANDSIFQMAFGNGGSTVSAVGVITYLPPNIIGLNAQLYNQTYQKPVDDLSPLNTDPINNYMRVQHTAGLSYTDVQITCNLGYNEPAGQQAFDNGVLTNNNNPSGSGSPAATYIFDEIGLQTYAANNNGMLLSHVIFSPVQKALNRAIEIIYTIRLYLT